MGAEGARTDLLAARQSEAVALLQISQAWRIHATAWLTIGWVVAVVAVVVAVAAHESAVIIPVGPAELVLCSMVFQQFADITVMAQARARLEALLREELGADALVYESVVSSIRQRSPLIASVRTLRLTWAAAIVALVIAGAVIAFAGRDTAVAVAYSVGLLAGGLTAALSYRDMLRSAAVGARSVASVGRAAGDSAGRPAAGR